MTYQKFGCGGNVESESHQYRTDQLEFRDGFDTDLFSLKFLEGLLLKVDHRHPSFRSRPGFRGEQTWEEEAQQKDKGHHSKPSFCLHRIPPG